MEFDFSSKIRELFESKASESLSSCEDGGLKESLFQKMENLLDQKVHIHNEKYDKKVDLMQLKKVYRRGLTAFASSHCPSQTKNGWAIARVNMFLKMIRGENVKEEYRACDFDLSMGKELYYEQKPEDCFWRFESIDFDLARIDLLKADINPSDEGFVSLFDMDYSGAEKKTLNKPFKLPSDPNKKFGVYVKNDKGSTVMVKFGDSNIEDGKDLRSYYQCDVDIGPRWKPKYWSCKSLSKKQCSSASSEDFLWSDDDFANWDFEDSDFLDQEDLFSDNPDLKNITEFVE